MALKAFAKTPDVGSHTFDGVTSIFGFCQITAIFDNGQLLPLSGDLMQAGYAVAPDDTAAAIRAKAAASLQAEFDRSFGRSDGSSMEIVFLHESTG